MLVEADAAAEGWAFRVDLGTVEGWLGCWFRGMSMSVLYGVYGIGIGIAVGMVRSRGE